MDRARADDHLARGDVDAAGEAHPDRAPARERHPIDQRVAPHDEVRPRARGIEVRVVGRHPPAVAQRERPPADAGRAGRVVVVLPREAHVDQSRPQPCTQRRDLVEGKPPQRDRTALAVLPVAAEVGVVLDPQKRLEHLGPAPAVAAQLVRPALVVVGRAADRSHRVDRRRPARAEPAHVHAGRLLGRSCRHRARARRGPVRTRRRKSWESATPRARRPRCGPARLPAGAPTWRDLPTGAPRAPRPPIPRRRRRRRTRRFPHGDAIRVHLPRGRSRRTRRRASRAGRGRGRQLGEQAADVRLGGGVRHEQLLARSRRSTARGRPPRAPRARVR